MLKITPKRINIKASIANKVINNFVLFLETLYIPNSFKSVPQFLQKRVLVSILLAQFGHIIVSPQLLAYIYSIIYFQFYKKTANKIIINSA